MFRINGKNGKFIYENRFGFWRYLSLKLNNCGNLRNACMEFIALNAEKANKTQSKFVEIV